MASDNVETLFAENSIAHIEEIEGKLLKEIEKKKDDLKQIIGEKYKDLIDVSDGLQVMAHRCLIIVEEIDNLDKFFHLFKSKVAQAITNRQKVHESPVNKSNLMQLELAMKCKIVVKAPSKIWYYLDNHDILSATFHFSQVCYVWSKLKQTFDNIDAKQNIVVQYADIVANFSNILINQAWKNVSFNSELNSDPKFIALNLTCISILQSLNPSQLLEMFLEVRYQQMVKLLENPSTHFESNCVDLFGNIFDSCRLTYLVFIEDMGIPNYLTRSRDAVQKFQASHDEICNQQYLSVINYNLKCSFLDLELDKTQVKKMSSQWVQRIHQQIIPLFSNILNQIDSIINLCESLKRINILMEDSSRLLNWSELNGILFDNGISIWSFFLQNIVMDVMEKLIITAVSNAFSSLQTSIRSKPTKSSDVMTSSETPVDMVWQNESEKSILSLKAYALLEGNLQICSSFEDQLKTISDQLQIIKEDASKALIPPEDLVTLKNVFTSSLADKLDSFLSNFESSSSDFQQNSDLLLMANIYRTLVFGCPQFKSCHYLFSNEHTYWIRSCSILQTAYNQFFIQFLSMQLNNLMDDFSSEMDVTSINKYLDLCLTWEELTLEETLEDGKTVRSTIRIPMQVSIPLYSLLKQLSITVNNIGAHTTSRFSLSVILSDLGSKLNSFYQQLLQTIMSKDISKSIKHTQILQFYFDISFLDQLIGLIKDDDSVGRVKLLLAETINSYQSQIDPFDLHVLQPHFQSSVSRCLKNNGLLFGCLIGQSTVSLPSSPSSTSSLSNQSAVKTDFKTDSPNPMPSYSLTIKFPLLLKSKSKK